MNKEENNPSKCPICGKTTHKESKYCIFHASAEEKTEKDFKRKLKEHVNKIKKEDGDYNFERFIFIGDIDCKKDLSIDIFKNANFNMVIFEGRVTFSNLIFKGSTKFENATFKKSVGFILFSDIKFEENVSFEKTKFYSFTFFSNIRFRKNVSFDFSYFAHSFTCDDLRAYKDISFNKTKFKFNVDFSNIFCLGKFSLNIAVIEEDIIFSNMRLGEVSVNSSIFSKNTLIQKTIFRKKVLFAGTIFYGTAAFIRSIFKGPAYFSFGRFEKSINLRESKFFSGVSFIYSCFSLRSYIYLDVKGDGCINFGEAVIEDSTIIFNIGENVSINFENAKMKNTFIEREQIKKNILQEKINKYNEAKKVFILLKNNFHSIGYNEDENWAFIKEKEMESKAYLREKKFYKWTRSFLIDFIYGYGYKPWKVVRFAIIVIIFFSFLYFNYGISIFIPEERNIRYDFFQNILLGIKDVKLLSNIIMNFPWEDYLNSLYFSFTTFATLAFGNIVPITIVSKIIAGVESFIGPFTIALFVYTFARKTVGR